MKLLLKMKLSLTNFFSFDAIKHTDSLHVKY